MGTSSNNGAKSKNFFQETLTFLCNNLGLNEKSSTKEPIEKKQQSLVNQKSLLHEEEIKNILLLQEKLSFSLNSIDVSEEDRSYSFLVDIVTSSISLSSLNNKNNNDDVPKSIEKEKRIASFVRLVQDIEKNILPSKFGLALLKIFIISSPNTYNYYKSQALEQNDSEVELAESMFATKKSLKEDHESFSVINKDLFLNFISLCLGKTGDKYSILRVIFAFATDDIETLGLYDNQNNEDVLREFFRHKWDNMEIDSQNSSTDNNENEELTEATSLFADADCLVDISYRLAVAVKILDDFMDIDESVFHPLQQTPYKSLKGSSLATSLFESCDSSSKYTEYNEKNAKDRSTKKRYVSFNTFVGWHNSKFPLFSSTFPSLMKRLIFPRLVAKKDYASFRFFPILSGESNMSESTYFNYNSSDTLNMFSFACSSKNFQGKWHKLYTSDIDGLSFNRLQLALFGYNGPTIMIIHETSQGGKFGAYTTSRWKESSNFYGNEGNCFLFQMEPHFKIMHPLTTRRSKRNFNYCKLKGSFEPGQARGIGFGGTIKKPRLFLSESFESCHALNQDSTFEKGDLLPHTKNEFGDLVPMKEFDIEYLEVWGVGGDDVVRKALGARTQHREIKDASLRKARQVDKAQFLNDFKSGLIESKAFAHRQQITNRDGGDVEGLA